MIRKLQNEAHDNAVDKGFWDSEIDIVTKMTLDDRYSNEEVRAIKRAFMCQRLLLVMTEVGEATDALRKDDKENYAEELADIVIRVFDCAGGDLIDLQSEIENKMKINRGRERKHGKMF